MAGSVVEVASNAELHALCSSHQGLTALLLWAPWHPPSVHLTKVLDAIAAEQKSVRFGKANTDVCASLATSLGASQVPFAAFFDPRGRKVDSLAGADPPRLLEKAKALATRLFVQEDAGGGEVEAGDLHSRLRQLIGFSPVMLFMKGSKAEPFCKFSKQAVAILDKHNVEYSTFDILTDDEVREGLKEFSNWKTYPQLYVSGELVGGVDIIKEMDEDGSLKKLIPDAEAAGSGSIEDRLKALINKAPIMLFMKGNPEVPRCGFSRKMCELLVEQSVKFDTFDILSDEDVRQELKIYSNWNTYPQLYAKGKLIGGLDIVKELVEEGSLQEELGLGP